MLISWPQNRSYDWFWSLSVSGGICIRLVGVASALRIGGQCLVASLRNTCGLTPGGVGNALWRAWKPARLTQETVQGAHARKATSVCVCIYIYIYIYIDVYIHTYTRMCLAQPTVMIPNWHYLEYPAYTAVACPTCCKRFHRDLAFLPNRGVWTPRRQSATVAFHQKAPNTALGDTATAHLSGKPAN